MQAGINTDQLTIVYEEAAVESYCQHMHLDNPFYVHIQDTLNSILEKGKKYMVVNLGGKYRYTVTSIFIFSQLN